MGGILRKLFTTCSPVLQRFLYSFQICQESLYKSNWLSTIIADLQIFQQTKPTWSVTRELLRLDLLPTIIQRSEALRKHQHPGRTTALHEKNEDSCTSDSSDSDRSEDCTIRKNVPIITVWKWIQGETFAPNYCQKFWGKYFVEHFGGEYFPSHRLP